LRISELMKAAQWWVSICVLHLDHDRLASEEAAYKGLHMSLKEADRTATKKLFSSEDLIEGRAFSPKNASRTGKANNAVEWSQSGRSLPQVA
jgi:hypothetical protein